ncbi:MAG: hypothetical protein ACXVP5_02595 [Tumebacillaceae bacterium]
MKKSISIFGTMALTLAIGVVIGQVGKADTPAQPGSADDPIVTKSYVDAKLAGGGGTNNGGGGSTGSDAFAVVQLAAGQVLKGSAGTEIILRSGSATAVSSVNGAVVDVSGSADLAQGAKVAINHLLLVPRTDGRGVKAGSSTNFFMVRGAYTIE